MRPDLEKTDQEIFDFVVAHLRKQGKAVDGSGVCVYRTAGGKSCAAGCIIPDDLYLPRMEGKTVKLLTLMQSIDQDLRMFLRLHHPVINELQVLHDNTPVNQWEIGFRKIAGDFSLLLDGQIVDKEEPGCDYTIT